MEAQEKFCHMGQKEKKAPSKEFYYLSCYSLQSTTQSPGTTGTGERGSYSPEAIGNWTKLNVSVAMVQNV